MKNKETIRNLQNQMNLIKARAAKAEKAKAMASAHDIKHSYIQNLHVRSSMFMLWLLSWVIFFIHKLPFIGKIATLLSLYYGRKSWWKILIKIRKVFIIFNALIGVYIVFKTTGFGPDNILAGIAGMGHTYLEILTNFTRRLFNWFVDLLDYKIVPNVPNTPNLPKNGPFWNPGTVDKTLYNSLNPIGPDKISSDWFKTSSVNINVNTTPWYRDITSWIWIGTIFGATVCTLGISYIGYVYLSDPILSLLGFKSNVTPPSPDGTITPTSSSLVSGVKESIVSYLFKPFKNLNPFSWFMSSTEAEAQLSRFMEKQNSLLTQDNKYYPFTPNNPYASWFERLRIHWLGETYAENSARIAARDLAWNELKELSTIGVKPMESIQSTPLLSSIGLGTPKIPSGSLDFASASAWYNKTAYALSSAPSTPGSITPIASINPIQLSNPFDALDNAVERLNSPNVLDSLTDTISAPSPISKLDSLAADAQQEFRLNSLKDTAGKTYSWVLSHNGKHN